MMSEPKMRDIKAEEAPLGVPLWPTFPGHEDMVTLSRVEVHRDETKGNTVRWVFRGDQNRYFNLGEIVAIQDRKES